MARMKLGIALGSGSARGWAHIGVLKALEERGIRPDVVCGSSVGALVGAAYASEQMEILEGWVRALSRLDVLKLLDASFKGGFMSGSRVMGAIGQAMEDRDIESLPICYGAVATDLETGREIWLREGPMLKAVRLSSGLPGLFSPQRHEDRWLVDGGVVNPVPVSTCFALGADIVVAVNLNHHLVSRRIGKLPGKENPASEPEDAAEPEGAAEQKEGEASFFQRLKERVGGLLPSFGSDQPSGPGVLDVVGTTINIMQERITASRMAGEPPHLVLSPNLSEFELMDFHRASHAIEVGERCVDLAERSLDEIQAMLGR